MTKEELNEHINDIRIWTTGVPSSTIVDWLKDIRDNGITEPKEYTVQVIKGDNRSFLNQLVNGDHCSWIIVTKKVICEHSLQNLKLTILSSVTI